jgi:ankyrin repeat protein
MLALLAKGAELEPHDRDRHTPLYIAACEGQVESVRTLLAKGSWVEASAKDGHTPLFIAAANGHVECVRELLAHGANIYAHGKDRHTPLWAARHSDDDSTLAGRKACEEELIARGAE